MRGYSEHAFQMAFGRSSFRLTGLVSDTGQCVDLIDIGKWNHLGGPDFLDARVIIDGNVFHGALELHRNPIEWYQHGHHLDVAYNCVVLHASPMPSKKAIFRSDGSRIPHVDIGRVMPSWLPSASMTAGKLACQKVLPSNLDALRSQLELASSSYFEELTGRHLALLRPSGDMGLETMRVMFVRACSVLGAPANREAMAEAAAAIWDSHTVPNSANGLAMRLKGLPWRQNSGRPASRPGRRLEQAHEIHRLMRGADHLKVLQGDARNLMGHLFRPVSGSPTGAVIFTTVLLPALWAHATLLGHHQRASAIRSEWDASTLAASPEASLSFGQIMPLLDARYRKSVTWLHRNMCTTNKCSSCHVGKRMMS
jgi:hypothetical protein